MRALLLSLCDDLAVANDPVPSGLCRTIAQRLELRDFDHWKVVGWIEGLNDFVYFLDVRTQFVRERDRQGFAEQLLADAQEKFYENSYLDDLFPVRRPEPARLTKRLANLCARLAEELTQEALFLVPEAACAWLHESGRRRWSCSGTLAAQLERAELAGTIPVGLDGAYLAAPPWFRRALQRSDSRVSFVVSPRAVHIQAGKETTRLFTADAATPWEWTLTPPRYLIAPNAQWPRGLTLGPTLRYDRQRIARTVHRSSPELMVQLQRALASLAQAWPQGFELLATLTSRIVPLHARGVVSFSYRHRPGISYINLFERQGLDTIDDLIHENSHHHLNLLLRKHVMYGGDGNQEIFYSPWRRSLRPLRGILHATFTFTMGALLFERLAEWGRSKRSAWRNAGLTSRDVQRAHFRCLEETESVRYSLQDLAYADRECGWIPAAGRRLVRQLAEEMAAVQSAASRFPRVIAGTSFARAFAAHRKELHTARHTYGPMEL
ncbi:MAG: HEXXH motif-containing putative peptide modification protein [Nitrospiraceae bacterium]